MLTWLVDGLIGLTILWLAWRAMSIDELYRAVTLFIAFGLVVSIAWVRLEAPDVAIAEAAIGAGLTGALLLITLSRLRQAALKRSKAESPDDSDT